MWEPPSKSAPLRLFQIQRCSKLNSFKASTERNFTDDSLGTGVKIWPEGGRKGRLGALFHRAKRDGLEGARGRAS